MPHRVVALCFDALVAFDLTAPPPAFQLAAEPSGRPLYEFSTCSPGGAPVQTTSGFSIAPDADLGALRRADTVVVPGYAPPPAVPPGYAPRFAARPAGCLRPLRVAGRRGAPLLSVCRGAFGLAPAWLL